MTIGKLCCVLVTTLLVTLAGCGEVQNESESQTTQVNESQTTQAVTGCELDCSNGTKLTCQQPCSVSGGKLTCNGTVHTCPVCVPRTCGTACGLISNGCGGTLNCGICPCPAGEHRCGLDGCFPNGVSCP